MTKKDVKLNNKRTSFSKNIKRRILLEFAKGEKPKNILQQHAFESLSNVTQDKKYSSKLLHKWRKELYANKTIIYFLNNEINLDTIDYEIKSIDSSEFMTNHDIVFINDIKDEFIKMINKT